LRAPQCGSSSSRQCRFSRSCQWPDPDERQRLLVLQTIIRHAIERSLRKEDHVVKIHKAERRPPSDLRPDPANPRTHSRKQISQIAESFKRFGFLNPIIVDERMRVIAGHGRLAAAERLGLESVPVIVVSGLSPSDKKRLMLADNKIAENAGWDTKALAAIFEDLVVEDAEIEVTGFETGEIDAILDAVDEVSDEADDLGAAAGPPVCQRGDEWRLGDHRLVCGDALCADTVARIGNGLQASAAFLDPPYNVEVRKIVGRGKRKHAEFAMGSGEMSREQFAAFLEASFTSVVRMLRPGAVAYVCIDWRSVDLVVEIGRKVFGTLLNAGCSTRALRRNRNGRGSNRRWMTVQWQVNGEDRKRQDW
jgi:hypothetical protein